jgi:hypothetical protein
MDNREIMIILMGYKGSIVLFVESGDDSVEFLEVEAFVVGSMVVYVD